MLLICGSVSGLHGAPARAADPVIAAAGDVACSASSSNYNGGNGTADRCRAKYTSDLLVNAGLSSVLVLGDSQYESASLSGLNNSYNQSWGRVKSITRPAAGNHEYKTAGAAGYFDYFNGVGQATGPAGDRTKGYYSFNVGTWHLIALNSTDHCAIVPCGAGSAQETWLKADLAANADKYCTLAYWHDPRFNSGHDGNADEMAALFQALYNADADVVLGGHAHDYERFAPQNPSGALDNARGIRQFVVGTGGAFWTSVGTPKPNSLIRQNSTYGVLKLTLRPTSYDWQFVPEAGKTFTDSGTGQCHGGTPPPPPPPTDTQKPTIPGNLAATPGVGQVALSWTASTDNVGVAGYRVYRGGAEIASVGATTSYTDTTVAGGTTYSYTVRAVDAAGNLSDPSNTASATTPATTTLTLSPEADARVQESAPTTNYATSNLRTDGGTNLDTDSFLRFTVGGLAGSVQNAKLRVYAYNGTVDGPAVYTTGSSWAETTINWNTRPLRTSAATGDKGAITSNTWVEYDVTPFVTGNGTYSFTLATTSSDGVDFRSREYATQRPELVLTVGLDSQKPTPPVNLTATAGPGQVALGWQGATDNVGVTGYRVFRGTAQIAVLGAGARSHTDTNLSPGPVQLHGEGGGRGREPLRRKQHRDRHRAGHDEADRPQQPHRHRRPRTGGAPLGRLNRQRRRDPIPRVPRHESGREPRRRRHLVHGNRSRGRFLQLHRESRGRCRERLGSEQYGRRHGAGYHEAHRPGQSGGQPGLPPGRAELGGRARRRRRDADTGSTGAPARSRPWAPAPPPTRTRTSPRALTATQ